MGRNLKKGCRLVTKLWSAQKKEAGLWSTLSSNICYSFEVRILQSCFIEVLLHAQVVLNFDIKLSVVLWWFHSFFIDSFNFMCFQIRNDGNIYHFYTLGNWYFQTQSWKSGINQASFFVHLQSYFHSDTSLILCSLFQNHIGFKLNTAGL